jgi:hypothetical protein
MLSDCVIHRARTVVSVGSVCECDALVSSSTVYTRVSNEPRMFRLIDDPSHGFIRVHAVSLGNRVMLIYAGSLPVSVPLLAQK